MLRLGDERDVRAVRVTRTAQRRVVGNVVRRLSVGLVQRCDVAGWSYPAASTGLDAAGHLDVGAMVQSIAQLAASGATSAELATHPGEHGDPALARYRWGYTWGGELDALCSATVRTAVDELGFELGTFGDLRRRASW
jgi:hypothetical protein